MENEAKWIGFKTSTTFNESDRDQKFGAPAVYLVKRFGINQSIKKATITATALGIYKLFINGRAVESVLEPGFTNYKKRIYNQKYEITSYIIGGENAFGAVVGDGWYTGNIAMVRRCRFGVYPLKFKATLEIEYYDGTKERICTDKSWGACDGAIRENDIINGEKKDCRLAHEEIFTSKFKGKLERVDEYEVKIEDSSEVSERVAEIENLEPKILVEEDRIKRYDFKQNFAGYQKIWVSGEKNQKIILNHSEMLNSDGSLYRDNYRSALNTDEVILKGDEIEEYSPTFCYHGFRYGEITSDLPFRINKIEGVVISNDLERRGFFTSSSPLINKIYSNVLWGQRSNFVSIATDCPQRDERLGWLADIHLFSETACYNMDCRNFYKKTLYDIMDDTGEEGAPDYSPYVNIFGHGNAGWADCAIILPYTVYKMYGDKEVLKTFMPLMKKHIEHSLKTSDNYIRNISAYSDWLNVNDETAKDVFATAYLYYSLYLYSEVQKILEINNDETLFHLKNTRRAFLENFVDEDYKIKSDTQSAYLFAYMFKLMSKEEVKPHLIRKLKQFNIHLSTGFNGCKYLLPTLSELGLDEYAYTLILNEDYPSWGYSIKNGATTIWERWNSYTKEDGFGDASMNSFNHYSFGSCVEWLYGYTLGITPIEAGFKSVKISPHFDPLNRVTSASGAFKTDYGIIKVSWVYKNSDYMVDITIPEKIQASFDFGKFSVISLSSKNGEYKIRLKELDKIGITKLTY